MVKNAIIFHFFVFQFLFSQILNWKTINTTREYSISGVAKFKNGFIAVHDNKKRGQARLSYIDQNLQLFKLIWPEKKLPFDLEAIFQLDPINSKYIIMESTGKCYIISIDIKDNRIDVLNMFTLPKINKNMNLEGFAIYKSSQGVVLLYGDRGSSARPSTLFWGFFNLNNYQIKEVRQVEFSLPQPEKYRRNIGDIAISKNAEVWTSATSDPGNNGPFSTYIYNVGNINNEGDFEMNHPELLIPIMAIQGQKVEAMLFNKNSLVLMTDNENYGSTFSIIKDFLNDK